MPKGQKSNTAYFKQLGACIKVLRLNKGYKSYETFAIEHNIDRKQYWRMENGANVTIKSLSETIKII